MPKVLCGGVAILRVSPRARGVEGLERLLRDSVRKEDQLQVISNNLLLFIPQSQGEADCELAALRVKSLLAAGLRPEEFRGIKVFTVPPALVQGLVEGRAGTLEELEVRGRREPLLSGEELPSLLEVGRVPLRLRPSFGWYGGEMPQPWREAVEYLLPGHGVETFPFFQMEDLEGKGPPALLFFPTGRHDGLIKKIRSIRKLDYMVLIACEIDTPGEMGPFDLSLGSPPPQPGPLPQLLSALFLSMERALWARRLEALKGGLAIRTQVHRLNQPLQVILSKLEIMAMTLTHDPELAARLEELGEKVVFVSEIAARIGALARELTGTSP